jgi:hypothetical protein
MERVVLAVVVLTGSGGAVLGQEQVWVRQFGGPANDYSVRVAADGGGNTYVAGFTGGGLFGPSAGFNDVFLAKYEPAGNQIWTRQFGSAADDSGSDAAVDSEGNVYLVGTTRGSLFGTSAGFADVFLAKYDSAGNQIWTRQFGSAGDDSGSGVAVDSAGNVYVVGGTLGGGTMGRVFLARYDAAGNQIWTRQLESSGGVSSNGVAVDSAGNVYLGGSTGGSLFGPIAGVNDAFLARYDAAGNQVWGRQFGTVANDTGYEVAVDSEGNVYLAGSTLGSLFGPSAGSYDAFLTKYDSAGSQVWGRQFGTASLDFGVGAAVDNAGNAYLAGTTEGSPFRPNAGLTDTFLVRYNAAGNQVWGHQLGTSGYDEDGGVAVDSAGFVYITGWTEGGLGGPNAGFADVFLAKYGARMCYANCDGSTAAPILNVNDFICFQAKFAAGDPYANCDGSTLSPVLNVNDFICFQQRFAAGCP